MMKDKEFINKVWNKYDNYINSDLKDNFYKKNKNFKLKRKLGFATNLIMGFVICTGVVYAGVKMYNFNQNNTSTDFMNNSGYDYNQDMEYSNGLYYKKIYSYDEYLKSKEIWANLVEMNEKDFNESFVIILSGENYNTTSLYISNISSDDEKLYIELSKKDEWNINETTVSVKIPKELDREKIEITNLPNFVNTNNKYQDINLINKNYSLEDAIKDNCFVVKNNTIMSENKNRLKDFMNNCNEKVNDMIRIYIDEDDRVIIYDIECKDKKINLVSKCFDFRMKEENMFYCSGNKIITIQDEEGYRDYILMDELGNDCIICSIKF